MKRWFGRLLALLLLLVWMLVLLFPVVAVVLATQKEISIGEERSRQLRLFLVQEQDEEGVGLEYTRATSTRGDRRCLQSSLRYLMWVGEGENVTYCRCYANAGLLESYRGACTPP